MRLLIVRHGETDWTITGQHTGSTELTLTEHGRAQALTLRNTISVLLGSDAEPMVLTSPRLRAVETATLAMPGSPRQVEYLLQEIDYGDFEGLTPDAVESAYPDWRIWDNGCPNGESIQDAGGRADRFLSKVELDSKPVVAFTHGHMSRIIAARALGLGESRGDIFASSTASVSVIETHRGRNVIKLWNYIGTLI